MELRRRQLFFSFFLWTVLSVGHVKGWPDGAPDDLDSCTTMLPAHGSALPQTTEMPYNVLVDGAPNNGSYDAAVNHTVMVSSKDGTTFNGYSIQARQYTTSTNFTTCGTFLTSNDSKITCQVVGGATVTQVDASHRESAQWTWIPPPGATGTVEFRGSITESEYIFWDIYQPVGTLPETTLSIGTTPVPASSEPSVPIDTTECDKTKGCYFSNCDDPNDSSKCEYGVMWSAAGPDGTAFELFASVAETTPYVALGLSYDAKMGDDSVTDCICNQATGKIDVQMSWDEGLDNVVLSDKTESLVNGSISGSFTNGMLICRFTRLTYEPPMNGRSKRHTETGKVFYPGSDLYHIMIAKGPADGGVKGYHPYAPAVSSNKVDFTQFTSSSENPNLSPLIKAHGIMMIIAWMIFASFATLMARYYKSAWPGKKLDGKPIWIQLHQWLMIIAFILTAVPFILIFIEVQSYSQLQSPAVAHAPLGIVAMALVLINPIMAHFRPDPKTKRRPLFNKLHFLVGLLCQLSAVVTMVLSFYITKLRMPEWCLWVMVFYICWNACTEIILAIHMKMTERRMKKPKKEEVVMQSSQEPICEEPKKSSVETYSLFRTAVGVLHLAGVLGCAIALSVQIGIS